MAPRRGVQEAGAAGARAAGAGRDGLSDGPGAVVPEETASGDAAGAVPALAIAGSGAAEKRLNTGTGTSFHLEEPCQSPRSDCHTPAPRRGTEASSTAATTARTDSTSPSPSASSSSRASASAADAAHGLPQQAPAGGREEHAAEEADGSPSASEQGNLDGSREPCAEGAAQVTCEEGGSGPGPLFEGTWEDGDGDLVRVLGTTLHGPDGELEIVPVDERRFTLDTGIEVFQAAVEDDGRLIWGDGCAWTRKDSVTAVEAQTPKAEEAPPVPPEQQLGNRQRWARITKDLDVFLAGSPSAPAELAAAGDALGGAPAPEAVEPPSEAPAPSEAPVETPAEALREAAAEAAKETQEQPVEACAEVSAEVPVQVPAEALAEAPPPLDPAPAHLTALLEPLREQLRGSVAEKLARYDGSYRYPRPEDTKTATRDGYEEQLLTEGLKELRTAIRKEYNYGVVGQVWKVVGGKTSGGIIARVDDEVRSDKADSRLSTGALVEELAVKDERLKYRLINGSGPESAWVSTKVKAGQAGTRDLVVKKPPKASPTTVAVLGLMAAHIRTEARLDRFCHVLRSVQSQKLSPDSAEFLFAVSWSSSPELADKVRSAIWETTCSKDGSGPSMFAVQQVERHSQFQHLKAALALAEERLRGRWAGKPDDGSQRSVWVLFGDDDDIWHSCRVAEYVGAIRAHTMLDGVGVFVTTARVNCSQNRRLVDKDMPVNEEQVDKFIKANQGVRMDKKEECAKWRQQYRSRGLLGNTQLVPVDMGLEYFDLCPRLRLVHEFFGKTSADFLAHRYCDLTFNEFLTAYPLQGREMGLEVSFFFPACWMLFYATPIPDEKAWKGSVEKGIDANNGHMSSTYNVEPIERELARRSLDDFNDFEAITEEKLARYWAAYRAQLECYLVRKRGYKVDQRIFDCIVFLALNGSFFDFWSAVKKKSKFRQQAAYEMMCYISQGFAKTIAASLEVDVLWLRPHLFLEPEVENKGKDQPHGPGYGHGWYGTPMPWHYGKGPLAKNYPFTGPWAFGKGAGKGVAGMGPLPGGQLGLNKPFGKGGAGKGGPGAHAPVFFSPYSISKPQKKR